MKIKLDIPLYVKEIAELLGAQQPSTATNIINSVTTDSREAESGDLFIALKGDNADGENYVKGAISKGAVAISIQNIKGAITVKDTVLSLQNIANYYKKKLTNLKYTVGVTGSVGKTTTKDFLKIISEGKYKTHATNKNYNNHIGVPLTILSAKADCEALILEMGMNHQGEISSLSKCAEPNIGVITNIGTAHIGNLGSRENIAKAKLEILDGMRTPGLIVPYGEKLLRQEFAITTFSTKDRRADIYIIYNEEKNVLHIGNGSSEISFKPRGEHMLECLCASVSAAINMGIETNVIKRQISSICDKIPRQTPKKVLNFYVLPDYYNASSESISAALRLLSSMSEFEHRSALIGTVKELGALSGDIHRQIGHSAALAGLRNLYFFGEFATDLFKGATDGGMKPESIFINDDESDPEKTAKQILENSLPGELILFKASNRVRLSRIVDLLNK